jgi:anthranilate/para-aminobenzoate synthase component I
MTNATTASVYRLTQVELVPFFDYNHNSMAQDHKNQNSKLLKEDASEEEKDGAQFDKDKIEEVVEKIKNYLNEGFFFAYNYDLTSNLQRQRKLYERHGFSAKGQI